MANRKNAQTLETESSIRKNWLNSSEVDTPTLETEKPKRTRRPDPMPFKVMRSVIIPDQLTAYAIVAHKEIIAVFSKNLANGAVVEHKSDEFFTLGEVIFGGRGSRKFIIAQSADMEFISTWKPS